MALTLTSADGKTSFDYNSVKDYKTDVLTLDYQDISANTNPIDRSEKQTGDMAIITQPYGHIVIYNGSGLTYGNLAGGKAAKLSRSKFDWTSQPSTSGGVNIKYLKNRNVIYRWKALK